MGGRLLATVQSLLAVPTFANRKQMKSLNPGVLTSRAARLVASLLAVTLVAACSDNLPTTAGSANGVTPIAPRNLIALKCVASRVALTVSCAAPGGTSTSGISPDGRQFNIIYGGQHQYVDITSSNASYSGTTFSFDVTVTNKIPQPLATTDGTNPDAAGVQIFFGSGPTATSGAGVIVVSNASGVGTFTGPTQPYFQYSGASLGGDAILSTNETSSSLNWQLTVPATVSTFAFTLYVSTEVPKPAGYVDIIPAATNVVTGGSIVVRGIIRSVLGDSVGAVTSWTSSDSSAASVNSSGIVTGITPAYVNIRGNYHSLVDSVLIGVCPSLGVGGVYTYVMPNASKTCFSGGESGEEYTYIPINLSSSSALSFGVTGSGIKGVTGPPTPDLRVAQSLQASGGPLALKSPSLEIASDLPIIEQDKDRLNALRLDPRSRVQHNRNANLRYLITVGVPVVGDLMNLNTNSSCSGTASVRTGRVRSISQHLIVVADTANPAGGFTTAQYDSIALEFDTLAYPVDSANFGPPTDLDENQRVVAFFTRAVNELSPPASSAVVLGYFAGKDIFSSAPSSCPNSNEGEMFYMLVPDPTGAVNSNVRTVSYVRGYTTGTMGHELQHMINASRRTYLQSSPAPFEDGYLNEGLSHIAEELMFYRASGMSPRTNIKGGTDPVNGLQLSTKRVAAYNAYENPNIGRFASWLQRPDTTGAFKQNANSLAVRGAIWAFLRYASDRVGGNEQTFWYNMVNTSATGTSNIQNNIGASATTWERDFITALYADDAGLGVASEYTTPSWNYRALYPLLYGSYQLLARPLTNNTSLTLSYGLGGGAASMRFGVASSTFATLTGLSGGVAPTSPYALVVVRTK
jgi:hypothetical protein